MPELRQRIEYTADYQLRRWLRHFRIAGNSPQALERTLQLCRQRRIQVVLTAFPVTAAHRRCYPLAIEKAFQQYLERVCSRYACHFVDCRDWLPDGLFVDNHHLELKGQIYFSRLFAYHVLGPLWQGQSASAPTGQARHCGLAGTLKGPEPAGATLPD